MNVLREAAHSAKSFPGLIKIVKLFVSVFTLDVVAAPVAATDGSQFDISIAFGLLDHRVR